MNKKIKTIFRVEKNKDNPFVMLDKRPLSDPKLSWKAKGIWAYLMSKPDDWVVILEDITKQSTNGEGSVRAGIKELEAAGYIKKDQERNEDGRYSQHIWLVYEQAQTLGKAVLLPDEQAISRLSTSGKSTSGKPTSGKPTSGKSTSGKPRTTNNDLTKNKSTEKEINQEVVAEPDAQTFEKDQAAATASRNLNPEIIARLKDLGIYEPTLSNLANMGHVTLEFIEDTVRKCREKASPTTGLLIRMIENDRPMSDDQKRQTFQELTALDKVNAYIEEYTSGEFARFIES